MIYKFTDFKQDDTLYNGYILEIQDVDTRFMYGKEPNFAAWLIDTNEVVVRFPSASFSFLHDRGTEELGKRLAKVDDERLMQPVEVARNHIEQDAANRRYKHVLYKFPDNFDKEKDEIEVVTNKVFSPKEQNGKIRLHVVPLASKFEVANDKGGTESLTSYRAQVQWFIAIDEKVSRQTKSKQSTNELEEQFTGLLVGMKF